MIACIIDIDGTLADASHRKHHIEKEVPDWEAFSQRSLVEQDPPQPGAKEALDHFRKMGYYVCFLTGRNEKYRASTEAWLNKHMGRKNPRNEVVYMRTEEWKDTPASQYKESQVKKLQEIFSDPEVGSYPLFFFEDDPFVARMYRKYGTVFKAPECWQLMAYAALDHEIEPVKRY